MQYRSVSSARPRACVAALVLCVLLALVFQAGTRSAAAANPRQIAPAPAAVAAAATGRFVDGGDLVRVPDARSLYAVDGSGLTAAIIDTGVRTSHQDFAGRVVAEVNFTDADGGDTTNATDGHGRGTHVAGIVAASGVHTGIAPGARIAALQALMDSSAGDFAAVRDALDWVIEHRVVHNIGVVTLAFGDGGNYRGLAADAIQTRIRVLRAAGVAVCAAAGDRFHPFRSAQGMAYPAVFPETVSVGAVFDVDRGPFSDSSGAAAASTGAGRHCPFSQRLHEGTALAARTDLFAPGAGVTATGIAGDTASAVASGTAQATGMVAGAILLMQEYHLRQRGSLPSVDQVERWLRMGAATTVDGDDEEDNVVNTGRAFLRLDLMGAMLAMEQELNAGYLVTGTVTLNGASLPGVVVSGGGRAASTGSDGRYTLRGLAAGTHTLTAARPNYLFAPSSRTVTVDANGASGVDFAATQTAYSISGTVTAAGVGLAEVTVTAGSTATTTDSHGRYTLNGVGAGSYQVTAARDGYQFLPLSRTVTVAPDRAGIDFYGTPIRYSVSGVVKLEGDGLAGVTVTAGGRTAVTDEDGTYALVELTHGTYTLAASRTGYRFTPATRSITAGPDQEHADFTAVRYGHTLQGTITHDGEGLKGVTVTAGSQSAVTDSDGRYLLYELLDGEHTVTPSRSEYRFAPASRTVTVTADTADLDFAGEVVTYRITGQVRQGAVGLAGIAVMAGEQSTVTDAEGGYVLTGLSAGTYTLRAQSDRFAFVPYTRTVTVGPDLIGSDFAATSLLSIRGAVREGEVGLPGVTVTAGGNSTVTGPDGKYELSGLVPRDYTVRAFREGYEFTPGSRMVVLEEDDHNSLDFAAVAVPYLVAIQPQKPSITSNTGLAVTVEFSRKVSKPTVITLTSTSPTVRLPRQVRIPRNRSRVTFQVRTRQLSSAERVTLKATSGGVTREATITVQPKLR